MNNLQAVKRMRLRRMAAALAGLAVAFSTGAYVLLTPAQAEACYMVSLVFGAMAGACVVFSR